MPADDVLNPPAILLNKLDDLTSQLAGIDAQLNDPPPGMDHRRAIKLIWTECCEFGRRPSCRRQHRGGTRYGIGELSMIKKSLCPGGVMTLVITRLTQFGIAMTADSALTQITPPATYRVSPSKVTKLFRIDGLNAGVSCWGRGEINKQDTDKWLLAFMEDQGKSHSIEIFANRLAHQLNEQLKNRLNGEASIGFHVAGYESGTNGPEPVFYHVHDGPSDFFPNANPRIVNCHRDCDPAYLRNLFGMRQIQEMRNGDFRPYAVIRTALAKAFQELSANGLPSIEFRSLNSVESYNLLEMRLMTGIYAIFGKPIVGGSIKCLALAENAEPAMSEHENEGGVNEDVEFQHKFDSVDLISTAPLNVRSIPEVGTSATAISGFRLPSN